MIPKFLLKRHASARNKVIARVHLRVLAGLPIVLGINTRLPGFLYGAFCHLNFRVTRAAGEIFNGMAVFVASGKVHRREVAAVAENFIHQADALNKFLPVKCRRQAHAGDQVAHRYAHRGLVLMHGADNFIRSGSLGGQALVEPYQHRGHLGIQIAQALYELHGKRRGQRSFFKTAQSRRRVHRSPAACAQQPVSQHVGFMARGAALHNPLRQPPQIFHHDNAQRDGHRPQFAESEGLHTLVGRHKTAKHFRVKSAVGVGHERPSHPHDARKALQMA